MTVTASIDHPALPITAARARVAWVDVAKGICIVLVVTMHTTLGVGLALEATGWLHKLVAYAKPFRMPDFFTIAGLFAGAAIAKPWRTFIDRKVLHFAYFLALWLAIILAVKSDDLHLVNIRAFATAYLWAFIEPFSTLWFIHILPLMFIALRLIWRLAWPVGLAAAIAIHIMASIYLMPDPYALASVWTGWSAVDNFSLFFVYFYIGAKAAPVILKMANNAMAFREAAVVLLLPWAALNALAVHAQVADWPGIGFILGIAGAMAVITISAIASLYRPFESLAYLGRHSLVIYLSFVIPMAAARVALVKLDISDNVDLLSIIVIVFAIGVPLTFQALIQGTPLAFLYRRPKWARLAD
ncbi:acyltransferase family protein [Roseiarcaceae bacterium H3SJ34-1]|uniref:acyltransferase family protein n=1 Tax=Terripilifer ovatus TaxID=3032367 RepID=UPI003AB99E1A|nr:acyltransferase family protein [Roseiarcaceae bacterium H3SJ34-1]